MASVRLRLTLTCIERTDDEGPPRRICEEVLWHDEHHVSSDQIAFDRRGASIPVLFALPDDGPSTTAFGPAAGIRWLLTAGAALPGVNLDEVFEVPVSGYQVANRPSSSRNGVPAGSSSIIR